MKLKIKKTHWAVFKKAEDKSDLNTWLEEQRNKLIGKDSMVSEPIINKEPLVETKMIKDNELLYRFCCPYCGEEIFLEGRFYKTRK